MCRHSLVIKVNLMVPEPDYRDWGAMISGVPKVLGVRQLHRYVLMSAVTARECLLKPSLMFMG